MTAGSPQVGKTVKGKQFLQMKQAIASWTQAVISFAVTASALFIILSGTYQDAEQKWAFGAIGAILACWLKR